MKNRRTEKRRRPDRVNNRGNNRANNRGNGSDSDRRTAAGIAGVLLLIASLGSTLYYILGPARGFFHADCADTIYWAAAAVKSGHLLDPDFGYAALLPFSANVWLIPLVAIFGMNYGTHSAGMCVFVLVFSASALYLARRLRFRFSWQALLVSCMLLLLSGSVKLREIMWGHVIYYSLGLVFLMAGLGLLLRLDSAKRPSLPLILLTVLTTGVAINGVQPVALYLLPLAGAVLLERFFDPGASLQELETKRAIRLTALLFAATLTGFVLLYFMTRQGKISAGYANAYSTLSSPAEWCSNAAKIVPNLLSLYGITVEKGTSLASLDAVIVLIRLAGLIILLVTPALLMIVYRQIRSKRLKYLLWIHHITAVILFFLVTAGSLGNANWRLTPVLGTAVLATVAGLAWMCGEEKDLAHEGKGQGQAAGKPDGHRPHRPPAVAFRKRLAAVCLTVLLLNTAVAALQIVTLPADYGRDNTLHKLSQFLADQQLNDGFATFWQAQAITLLTGEKVRVRNMAVDQNGISPRLYQSNKQWYSDQPESDSCFLLLDEAEFNLLCQSPDWPKLEGLVQETLAAPAGYTVVILSRNPWTLLNKAWAP